MPGDQHEPVNKHKKQSESKAEKPSPTGLEAVPEIEPLMSRFPGELHAQSGLLRRLHPDQRSALLTRLNQEMGNRYVQRLVKNTVGTGATESGTKSQVGRQALPLHTSTRDVVMRYTITLERSGSEWSGDSIASVRRQLEDWGVTDFGDLTRINNLTSEQIHAAMATIERLRTMGGRGGAVMTARYASRIIAGWNAHKDDLGSGRAYPTIVHFVVELERLTQAQLGMGYIDAIRSMPGVRLAGVEVGVNQRAVYFVAAAQAEMDVASGVEEGEGHYTAPGAYMWELRQFQRRLQQLARRPRRTRSGEVRGAGQQEIEEVGAQAFNILRSQVVNMIDVMEVQEGSRTMEGVSADEHREPGLRNYLSQRKEQLRAIPEAASADDARRLAGQMVGILGTVPVGQAAHGFGSIDPHGTDHAVGLAIDLFNGRGSEGVAENFGVQGQYWVFLHRVIDLYGSDALKAERPTAIHRLEPALARELAGLVRDRGQEVADALQAEASEPAAAVRARRQVMGAYQQAAARIRGAYFTRWQQLTMNLSRRAWFSYAPEVRASASRLQGMLNVDRRAFLLRLPSDVLNELTQITALLEQLYVQGTAANDAEAAQEAEQPSRSEREARTRARRRQNSLRVLELARPSAGASGRTLAHQQEVLSERVDEFEAAQQAAQDAAIRGVLRTPAFRQWIRRVTSPDYPLYDQPTIVINAMNNVIGHRSQAAAARTGDRTRFYGGHHWQVMEREALTSDARYLEILQLDMRQERRRSMIQRVLTIMAESAGGRAALAGGDTVLLAALRAVYGDPTAMIQAALGATASSGDDSTTPLQNFLSARGYHYLAGDEEETTAEE